MNIIAYTSSNAISGGVQQAVYQTLGLRARGHNAVLCVMDATPLFQRYPGEEWLVPLSGNDKDWRAEIEARFGDGPAVIHAFHNRAVKLAAWWGLFWRKRGVVAVAHRGIVTRPKNPLTYLSPGVKFFLPNSQACARSLNLHCPPWKIRMVPNGLPPERVTPVRSPHEVRAELDLPEKGLNLIYVGNDNPVKGAGLLLRAFARVCAELPQVQLIMVGLRTADWVPLVTELGIEKRVRILGYCACVSDYLQVADALVFSSLGMDSAPNVLLEAICMGLPVVSSNVGGCPEIVDGNGVLVPAGKLEPLAEGIRRICTDEEQRRAWAARSLVVGQRYSMDARCGRLEEVYAEALGSLKR